MFDDYVDYDGLGLAAGVIVFGKTNTPEYKLSVFTMPRAWGATRNPIGPDFGWEYEGQSTSHIVSRTVRDSAAMLDATAGPELGSPYVAPGPTGFLAGLEADLGQLRVGMSTATEVFGVPMESPCVDAVRATGRILQDLGHIAEEVPLPFDEWEVLRASIILGAANTAAVVSDLEAKYGRAKVHGSLEEVVRLLAAVGRALPAEQVGASRWTGYRVGLALAKFYTRHDLLLIPTMGRVPVPLEEAARPSSSRPSLGRSVDESCSRRAAQSKLMKSRRPAT